MRKGFLLIAVLLLGVIWQTDMPRAVTAKPEPEPVRSVRVKARYFESKLLRRKMHYQVILPVNYVANGTERYAVIYLLHGLNGDYTNWASRPELVEYSANFNFIIVSPEGGNSWYTDAEVDPSQQYERYFLEELIPEIESHFSTINDREHRIVAGLSMGGYGAIKFGLKHPDKFSLVGSFSGAVAAPSYTESNDGEIGKAVDKVFGDRDSETRRANDLARIIREASPESVRKMPFIYLSCGTEDPLLESNRDLRELMVEKNVPHEYRERPGGHDWKFWTEEGKEFLELADRLLRK
jgi:putative tributyrin esterase